MNRNCDSDIEKQMARLTEGLKMLGIAHGGTHIGKFKLYLQLLYAYRGRVNLLSRNDYPHIVTHHFLESLLALPYLPPGACSLCDVGTGAGFPGVPLKIMRPDMSLTLVESKKKKAAILEKLVENLKLDHVTVKAIRIEALKGDKFDIIVFRAAGKIETMLNHAVSLLAQDGQIIFYKTHDVEQELNRAAEMIKRLGLKHTKLDKLYSPLANRPVSLVVVG